MSGVLKRLKQQQTYSRRRLARRRIDARGEHVEFRAAGELYGHTGCVNSVHYSASGQWLLSGGDDTEVFLWAAMCDATDPPHFRDAPRRKHLGAYPGHFANIFTACFTAADELHFVSGGLDHRVLLHDVNRPASAPLRTLHAHNSAVLRIVPMRDNVVACTSGDAYCLCDVRAPSAETLFYRRPTHGRLCSIARVDETTCAVGLDKCAALVDVRLGDAVSGITCYFTTNLREAMSVDVNASRTLLLVNVRRGRPLVFDLSSAAQPPASLTEPPAREPLAVLPASERYSNGTTMKHATFARWQCLSSDDWVFAGSDSFLVFAWRLRRDADGGVVVVQRYEIGGHRSIPNSFAAHPFVPLVASSGVEKTVRLWTPYTSGVETPERETTSPIYMLMREHESSQVEDLSTLSLFDRYVATEGASSGDGSWSAPASSSSDDELGVDSDSFIGVPAASSDLDDDLDDDLGAGDDDDDDIPLPRLAVADAIDGRVRDYASDGSGDSRSGEGGLAEDLERTV